MKTMYQTKIVKVEITEDEEYNVLDGNGETEIDIPLDEMLQKISYEMDQLKYLKKRLLQHESRKN